MSSTDPQVIAFYLPQFHPVAENDEWWGPGFTEWSNVARARPLYPGQYQPRLPGQLGFYDLRLDETRHLQAELARRHGVTAFCYWHYWFGGGRRILERPFLEVLRSGEPDFPFCLAWANQSWEGRWHGAPHQTLIAQEYPGIEDERSHFEFLLEAFEDPRYVRVDGRPLLYVYQPRALPDPPRYTDQLREWAREAGLPDLYLVGETYRLNWCPSHAGFDAGVYVEIPPVGARRRDGDDWQRDFRLTVRLRTLVRRLPYPEVLPYARWAPYFPALLDDPDEVSHPCVVPDWDNTPRTRARGVVLHGARPELFRSQVERAVRLAAARPGQAPLLFIKSWNEWAEGNYLEPDVRFGSAYLGALADGLARWPSAAATGPLLESAHGE